MGRRHRRSSGRSARTVRRARLSHPIQPSPISPRLGGIDRRALLLGTALASSLLIGSLLAPTPAAAVACDQPASPNPIIDPQATFITCINTEPRTNAAGNAIDLETTGIGSYIDLYNSGILSAYNLLGAAIGIQTTTVDANSPIDIVNSGDIGATTAGNGSPAFGINAVTLGGNGSIDIVNSGDIGVATAGFLAFAFGFYTRTDGGYSPIDIVNTGGIDVATAGIFSSAYGIFARTFDGTSPINIVNSGDIGATTAGNDSRAYGIFARTFDGTSPIDIVNSGGIALNTAGNFSSTFGIDARTFDGTSPIDIVNSGGIDVATAGTGSGAFGIHALTDGGGMSPIDIVNSGGIDVVTTGNYSAAFGIYARTDGVNSPISIVNSGDITATGTGSYNDAYGIQARTGGTGSSIFVENSGDMTVTAPSDAAGIFALAQDNADVPVTVINSGNLTVTSDSYLARGINATSVGENSPTSVWNSGDLTVTVGDFPYARAIGIDAGAGGDNSPLSVWNSGNIEAIGRVAFGILAETFGPGSPINIVNSGDIVATGGDGPYDFARGIDAHTYGDNSPISVVNSGDIAVTSTYSNVFGIRAGSFSGPVSVENSGDIVVTGGSSATGIQVSTGGDNDPVTVMNSGNVSANGVYSYGISAFTLGDGSPINLVNSGNVFASGLNSTGIYAFSGATDIVIVNTGSISASSFRAIYTYGGSTTIYNYGGGVITGFVDLGGGGNRFFNQAGGVFEARRNSYFGGSPDLFRNEQGGIVHTADNPLVSEYTAFFELERFENRGLISLVDGRAGDIFRISDTLPLEPTNYFFDGGTVFNGGSGSTLAVDTFLGGPGSASDIFIIDGDVTGKTTLAVNNTNAGPGVFNPEGIPVVFVGGNVKSGAFSLAQPIDTGFFNYDLFFEPTGSGFFDLRSFPGGGALLLPQMVTGAQDIWHQGSSTWFDRTADLRVLLAGGAAPIAYDPGLKSANGMAQGAAMTPAVWARGSGAWLDRERSETVTAYGRDYRFNLDRDLTVIDWQMGLDLGKRDLFSQGDILVFGVLGGFVGADLDYNQLIRNFDFSGGQVGGYATYLRGGLFVDTLLNVHLLELETATLGFPSSLDATTVGLRTDTGYRFGSFGSGAFIEPLATLSVTWADIDGFALGGNTVSFDDEANVRGRLGLRVGTSYPIWGTTTVEPFVIGSLWGNLSGDNQATLVSTGTTFRFEDDLDDMWGEVSAGVNFFNPSASTAVFAKLDVTFGDDVDGIGGKAGMRVSW